MLVFRDRIELQLKIGASTGIPDGTDCITKILGRQNMAARGGGTNDATVLSRKTKCGEHRDLDLSLTPVIGVICALIC